MFMLLFVSLNLYSVIAWLNSCFYHCNNVFGQVNPIPINRSNSYLLKFIRYCRSRVTLNTNIISIYRYNILYLNYNLDYSYTYYFGKCLLTLCVFIYLRLLNCFTKIYLRLDKRLCMSFPTSRWFLLRKSISPFSSLLLLNAPPARRYSNKVVPSNNNNPLSVYPLPLILQAINQLV